MPKDALEFQQMVSDFANAYNPDTKKFIRLMSADHRTIQQGFTKLCLQWLEHVASEEYRTDGRNIASQQVARELIDLWYAKDKRRYPSVLPSVMLPMI